MKFGSDALPQLVSRRDANDHKPRLRIVLVQEHEVLRDGLEILLEKQGDFSVIGSFDTISEALDSIPKLQPDLLLTDWKFGAETASEFLAQTRRLVPACKSIVLSALESQDCVRAALHAGADGFIVLLADLSELTCGIRSVASGRQFICNSTATRILTAHFSAHRPAAMPAMARGITGREREVLTRIALGNSNKAIARELGVSPKTVETHRAHVLRKLGVHSIVDLVRFAARHQLPLD